MTSVPIKLRQHLPAILNPDDLVVSAIQTAQASVFEDAESLLDQVRQVLSVLEASGEDLDMIAHIYGLNRLVNETDAHLLERISLRLQEGATSPQGIVAYLQALGQTAALYEPSGGSFVKWDPRVNFRFDRSAVAPTFTRSSTATYNNVTYQDNQPVYLAQGNYFWVGIFPANGATSASSPDTMTIPATNVIGTQSQGMIAIGLQTGSYGPASGGYLLDYDGTFSLWYDGSAFNWLIGGVTLTVAYALTSGDAYLIVANWGQGEAALYVNGIQVASATVSSPPTSVSGNVYIGSDHTGANQISAFLGNFAFLEAAWPASRIAALQTLVATPIYAQTLYSGAYFSESLVGIQGGMIDGVSNYVGVYAPGSSTLGFYLDQDYLDSGYLQNASQIQTQATKSLVFPLLAAGKKPFLYTLGQQT